MNHSTLHGSTFFNGDAVRGALDYIPNGSVDLIITDPPYGIDGHLLHRHYNRHEEYVIGDYVEVKKTAYAAFSKRWIRQAERVLRPGGSIYIVSGYTNLVDILNALKTTSLREVNHIIWKYRFGVFTKNKYISSHYHILFYEKPGGKRTFNAESRYGFGERTLQGLSLNNTDREDVWIINREYKPRRKKNKNELPLSLLQKMILYSSNEGDLVLDFFLGGFSTARAAIGLNRRATGFEIAAPLFAAKVAELAAIEPGDLLPTLRRPALGSPVNRGKRWTEVDRALLEEEYARLIVRGIPRYRVIAELGTRLGRGRFAIERALKNHR
jgi:site-specific DNA-methyltransferase (adenine-specific)